MLVATLAALVVGGRVEAVGLGPATAVSSLGQPLRVSIPVIAGPDDDIGCVAIRPRADGLPSVFNVRTQVLQVNGRTRLEVVSGQRVDEPALGMLVSVGCTNPVARDYVFLLDPPVIAPPVVAANETRTAAVPPPRRARARTQATAPRRVMPAARPSSGGAAAPRASADAPVAASPAAAPPAATASAAAPPTSPAQSAQSAQSARADAPSRGDDAKTGSGDAAARAKVERDRLTVAASGAAKEPPLPSMGAPAPASTSAPPVSTTSGTAETAPSSSPAAAPAAVVPDASTTPDPIAAREELLQREQAQLRDRIRSLSDQIESLRVSSTTLAARNEQLESGALPSWVPWLLIALAALAIVVAGWMAWRYAQLRRAHQGSAWWGGNTVPSPEVAAAAAASVTPAPSAPTSRVVSPARTDPLPTRSPPSRVSSPPTPSTIHARSRPQGRDPRYATSIDTDFTVSDIEAAMATVRTVSPSHVSPAPVAHAETDFSQSAGHTLPSPFADPPAGARSISEPVDLDIPPMPEDAAPPRSATGSSKTPPPAEPQPLDFKLDLPGTYDPLATDSNKTTIVLDETHEVPGEDRPLTASMLDFELPSATSIMGPNDSSSTPGRSPPRQGAAALDDLFSSMPDASDASDAPGGTASPASDIDRLVRTEIDSSHRPVDGTPYARLRQFADLMDQIDAVAETEPARAIAILRQYVLRDEDVPTLFWLKLFALYAADDKRAVYEALGTHWERRYRRPPPPWGGDLGALAPQLPLNAMPAIDRAIEAGWGKAGGSETLRAFLCDHDQPDTIVFNATLQQDLLDTAKVFPVPTDDGAGPSA